MMARPLLGRRLGRGVLTVATSAAWAVTASGALPGEAVNLTNRQFVVVGDLAVAGTVWALLHRWQLRAVALFEAGRRYERGEWEMVTSGK